MNAAVKLVEPVEPVNTDPLAKLREPFPAHQISKLPKPTKQQTDDVKADYRKGIRCKICGSWHHPDVVHLDYVGHAALTDRLLDTDPNWTWEPVAFRDGLPAFDSTGGLWIKLTVCGTTRLGYGHAAVKSQMDPGAREKECIGDALRNAAMRFGAALDLWHKGDLHQPDASNDSEDRPPEDEARPSQAATLAVSLLSSAKSANEFKAIWEKNKGGWKDVMAAQDYAYVVAAMKSQGIVWSAHPSAKAEPTAADVLGEDEIPY